MLVTPVTAGVHTKHKTVQSNLGTPIVEEARQAIIQMFERVSEELRRVPVTSPDPDNPINEKVLHMTQQMIELLKKRLTEVP